MKAIEKKLASLANEGNLVSPLLLDKIKERTAEDPIEKTESARLRKRRNVMVSIKAAASACAVFAICFVSFFLILPMFMRASSPPRDESPGGSMDQFESTLIDRPVVEYATENGLRLLTLDGECLFYMLTSDYADPVYRSDYERDGYVLVLTQTTSPVDINDLEYDIVYSQAAGTYDCVAGEYEDLRFELYETDYGMIARTEFRDGNTVFLQLIASGEQPVPDKNAIMKDAIGQIEKNFSY